MVIHVYVHFNFTHSVWKCFAALLCYNELTTIGLENSCKAPYVDPAKHFFSTYNFKTISKANIKTHVYPNDTYLKYNLPSFMLKWCFSYSNQLFRHLRENIYNYAIWDIYFESKNIKYMCMPWNIICTCI